MFELVWITLNVYSTNVFDTILYLKSVCIMHMHMKTHPWYHNPKPYVDMKTKQRNSERLWNDIQVACDKARWNTNENKTKKKRKNYWIFVWITYFYSTYIECITNENIGLYISMWYNRLTSILLLLLLFRFMLVFLLFSQSCV